MITKSNKSIFAPSIALVASLASSIPLAAQSSYSLGMENDTGYNIYQVRMSSVHPFLGARPPGIQDLLGRNFVYHHSDHAWILRYDVRRPK